MIQNIIFYTDVMPWVYLFSTLALLLFGYDKHCAVFGKRRIPEFLLYLVSVPMGAFGALCGMVIFNHKTRKKGFYIAVPVMLAVQLAVVVSIMVFG